jgi:2-isopropylmalate synthase
MPYPRYVKEPVFRRDPLTVRSWPDQPINRAPLWASVDLRDGNQSLANPMSPERKATMLDLLIRMGFKEIEVGYPSASEADFSFVRSLALSDRIPDDVRISVFTPAKEPLIDRTFEAIAGLPRVTVHLCHATACLWREVVFGMTAEEVAAMGVRTAEYIARRAERIRGTDFRFEYSPETFNITEPDFALDISNAVIAAFEADYDRPVTLNLPTTVETDSPILFADQIEWMHRNLERRDSVILSVHPHNDRGTAVASAELAVMAGADRVEGTLFGNGERTGNVCLATLALNLFSEGIDPQLDFSDIDEIRRTVEFCNQMPVHSRHPYAGDLVYTAFSGTHQDAIHKGFTALAARATAAGLDKRQIPWSVPYLPIDPADVGRTYESVVRLNSQSGKGGIAHVLHERYGLELPTALRVEFARSVQHIADQTGSELSPEQVWDAFRKEYLRPSASHLMVKEYQVESTDQGSGIDVLVVHADGEQVRLTGQGSNPVLAYLDALRGDGITARLVDVNCHILSDPAGGRTAAYARVDIGGESRFGVGIHGEEMSAMLEAVTAAVDRGLA